MGSRNDSWDRHCFKIGPQRSSGGFRSARFRKLHNSASERVCITFIDLLCNTHAKHTAISFKSRSKGHATFSK